MFEVDVFYCLGSGREASEDLIAQVKEAKVMEDWVKGQMEAVRVKEERRWDLIVIVMKRTGRACSIKGCAGCTSRRGRM